jgi:hypothetical protein
MRIFDLLLCVSLLGLAAFLIRMDVHDYRGLQRARTAISPPADIIAPIQSVVGYDGHGQRTSTLPLGIKRLVIFVLHGNTYGQELDFWNQAEQQNTGTQLAFVGICGDETCVKKLTEQPESPHFSALVSADYLALRSLLKVDAETHMLLLDRESGKARSIQYPSSLGMLERLKPSLVEGL